MRAGLVYEIVYDCRPRGCDDADSIIGFWTGEVDTIGKLTIWDMARARELYLFPDEIVESYEAYPSDELLLAATTAGKDGEE